MKLQQRRQATASLEEAPDKIIQSDLSERVLNFVSTGVGCFALTLVQSVGIVNSLIERGYFHEDDLKNSKKFKNFPAIRAALLSLCLCDLLTKDKEKYFLTTLGKQLVDHIGLVTMVFGGYGELMAKGISIALGKVKKPEKYLKNAVIALSSIQFGEKVDPILTEVIKKLDLKGTICDVGCGSADRLLRLCKDTSLPGLGLDSSHEAVAIARRAVEPHQNISIEYANAVELEGVWEDVQLLMQCFMTHDIFPDDQFIKSLSAYRKNFPNLRYFIVIDIVAPEDSLESHMPAYDFVHGLLGIETRKYGRFTSLFLQSGYKIAKEICIDMPNTYLWVLKPA
jgi:hypothetical protein